MKRSLSYLLAFLVVVKSARGQDCHQGWTPHNDQCYGFGENAVTWGDAEEYCRIYYAHLVEVNSASERDFLKNLATSKQATGVWLGATDMFSEGNWEWTNSFSPIEEFADWASGEPNNAADEDCVMMDANMNYQWNDIPCDRTFNFICETQSSGDFIVG